jgi:putative GTP pyrophosphokinase
MNETKINAQWHREQVQKYREVQPEFQTYAEVLEDILKKAGELYAPLCIVGARAKSISSFAEKAVRKAFKYKDPVNQITDLCGARVITHFQYQAEQICRFIRNSFDIDEANSLDVRSRLRVSEFGYRSVHYVVTPKTSQVLGIPIPKAILGKKAEIQVRTLLQHAWADISHDRM